MNDIVGIDQVIINLRKALVGLPPEEIRAVGIKASQPIVDAARALAPVGTGDGFFFNRKGEKVTVSHGNLRRSIQVLKKWPGDPSGVYIGPKAVRRNASGKYTGDRVNAYYAAMVEFGTAAHRIGYGGNKGPMVQGIKPHPFMRPAFDSTKDAVMNAYYRALESLIFKHAPSVGSV